jgi:tight adherence protein B
MAGLLLVAVAFLVGVALVMALYAGASKLPELLKQRQLGARLQEVTQHEEESHDPADGRLVKVQHTGPLPGVDRLIAGSARGSLLTLWIAQSGTALAPSGVILIALALAVVVALLAGSVSRSPWGLALGAALGCAVPFLVLKVKRTGRMRVFEEEFPEALDLIARALKAGHAFATGLKMVADEMNAPVGPEFRKTFDEQNFGLPLKDALDNLTHRVPLMDVRFFTAAVLIQRETGGNLAEILENLAHVVRERFKILRQVRVYTAHGRFTGYVLLALPAVLCMALAFINPDHMNLLFRERMGQMMLIGALVLQTIGFLWIRQVIKIEV